MANNDDKYQFALNLAARLHPTEEEIDELEAMIVEVESSDPILASMLSDLLTTALNTFNNNKAIARGDA